MPPRPAARRLGVLVLADEILNGHVHESNSHWLAQQVKPLGIRLARVEIAGDAIDDIVASVRRFLFDLDLDYVVTSGGLGPTHDDRTMEGLAKAIGRPLEQTAENLQWMRERARAGHARGYFESPEPNAGLLKMTWLPAGAEPILNPVGSALGAIVTAGPKPTTLFTLPGVPSEFYRMFDEAVRPRLLGGTPFVTEELVLYTEESRLYGVLKALEEGYPDVVLGSYPEAGRIRIRATGAAGRAADLIGVLRGQAAAYLEPSGRFRDP